MNGPFDIGDVSPRRYFAVTAVVLGLLFAFVAGDDESPVAFATNLIFWQLQACIPMVLLLTSHVLWLRIALFESLGAWVQLFISGISGAMAFSPIAALLDGYLEGNQGSLSLLMISNEAMNITPPITLAWVALNAPFVLGLRLVNTGAQRATFHDRTDGGTEARREVSAPSADELTDSEFRPSGSFPNFMALVAPSVRGRLIYLRAGLHYLAVVTEFGRSLILYNLRDAVAELDEDAGLLIHRSFWASRTAISGYRRSGRQGALTMDNGDEIPVSRRRIVDVELMLRRSGGIAT